MQSCQPETTGTMPGHSRLPIMMSTAPIVIAASCLSASFLIRRRYVITITTVPAQMDDICDPHAQRDG